MLKVNCLRFPDTDCVTLFLGVAFTLLVTHKRKDNIFPEMWMSKKFFAT